MTDPVDLAFRELQLEYLDSLPARLEELRSEVAAWRAGNPGAGDSLKVRLHRLAGSGGSYGFTRLSAIAREAERWLAGHTPEGGTVDLEAIIERLVKAVEEAGRRVGG